MKKIFLLVLANLLAFTLFGCENGGENSSKIKVAVTIKPQEAFVRAVCGDLVDIIPIIPPGASPESYEPTAKQLTELAKANLYFTIGVPIEQAKLIPEVDKNQVVRLEDKLTHFYSNLYFENGERDPHIWLSPKRTAAIVKIIYEEMAVIDSKNKEEYKQNAENYFDQLNQLDAYINELFSDIDNNNNVFLTFHPAYNYFADDYGLRVYALEQEGREATAQDLQDMIDFAKKNDIKVIFTQAENASRQPAAFAEEVGGEVCVLDPLSEDYINNIKHMAEQIAKAIKSKK